MLTTIRMKRRIALVFLVIIIFQIVGYYTIGKKLLVSKLTSERERIAGIEDVDIINVNSNYEFNSNHKVNLNRLFEGKPLSYHQYQDIEHLPSNRIFPEDTLCYTFDVTEYKFPVAVVTQSETIKEFGAHDSVMYAWILFLWVEVKYLGGGIS
jgi:hypothetical protein